MRTVVVNAAYAPWAVTGDASDATAWTMARPDYAPTPLRELEPGRVWLKDESDRFGLPAFKVLGAAWAVERALRETEGVTTLVAASAGNHGRAVARVAHDRGLACRVFLPARSVAARREAIASEGAEVVVVDGSYEDAVAAARWAATDPGALEISDVGEDDGPPRWVIEGYATLFGEVEIEDFDLVLVPAGVGALAAAAARAARGSETPVVAVEPATAACVGASLAAGVPVSVATPGTTMAGLDCADVSPAAWHDLRVGLAGAIAVTDAETHAAMTALARRGLAIGDAGAAPLAALHVLRADPDCAQLRLAIRFGPRTRVLLIATEGVTDPDGYARNVGRSVAPS